MIPMILHMYILALRTIFDSYLIHLIFRPISVRLLELACFKSIKNSAKLNQSPTLSVGWKGMEDVLKYLPGPMSENVPKSTTAAVRKKNSKTKTTTLVVYIGGITFTEISAIRFLSQQYGGGLILFLFFLFFDRT